MDLSGGDHHTGEEDEVLVEHHHPTLFQTGDHHYKDSLCNNKEREANLCIVSVKVLFKLDTEI
jgi:hypothetical protein